MTLGQAIGGRDVNNCHACMIIGTDSYRLGDDYEDSSVVFCLHFVTLL